MADDRPTRRADETVDEYRRRVHRPPPPAKVEQRKVPTRPEWRTYRPTFAPHVVGDYETRAYKTEMLPDGRMVRMQMPQTIKLRCEQCGHRWSTVCTSGQVRSKVAQYGRQHLHRDPFAQEGEDHEQAEDSERGRAR